MPMPVDMQLTFKDGNTQMYNIPLNLMFGAKPNENPSQNREVMEEWKWTHPAYIVEVKHRLTDIKIVDIDPTKRMAELFYPLLHNRLFMILSPAPVPKKICSHSWKSISTQNSLRRNWAMQVIIIFLLKQKEECLLAIFNSWKITAGFL